MYFDLEGKEVKDVNLAVQYTITEKSAVGNDSLFKKSNYFISGQKKSEYSVLEEYKQGRFIKKKIVGEKWEWFENGNIHLKAFYNDNQLNGEFCTYWPNGTQRRKDTFDNGKLIEGNCYDSIGQKIKKYFPYETAPEFAGGVNKLFEFLAKEQKYPTIAMENNIQGKVVTQFYIDENGKITDLEIIRNANYYLDVEALRVINAMPVWTPGTLEGKNVKVKITLPIYFRIQ
ncbi:MAG: TonB family protein [Bacteroidales bacterium]|nr:TonB family protein [Bacteroidales bacterium]